MSSSTSSILSRMTHFTLSGSLTEAASRSSKSLLPKSLLLAAVGLCFIGLSSPLQADIQDPPGKDYGPTRKLGRGLANVAYAPLELPYQMIQTGKKSGSSSAFSYGILKGSGATAKRFGYGVYESVTFLFPTYKGSFRVPYKQEHRFVNGGLKEFPPVLGGETHFPWVRID